MTGGPAAGKVLRPAQLAPVDRGGGARTVPLVTRAVGSTSMLNGITTFEPGASIPLHSHNCEESVLVLEGDFIAVMGDEEQRLGPLDTTFIPSSLPHRFINASPTRPAKIFWTYASVEATRTLIATGETRAISAEHAEKQA